MRVPISDQLFSELSEYSDLLDIPIKTCINEAIEDWLNTTGFARMESEIRKLLQPTLVR